jgi:hypothetical protein
LRTAQVLFQVSGQSISLHLLVSFAALSNSNTFSQGAVFQDARRKLSGD